jgi:hypothetical protein
MHGVYMLHSNRSNILDNSMMIDFLNVEGMFTCTIVQRLTPAESLALGSLRCPVSNQCSALHCNPR